jgi:hypothetical protein
MGFQPNNSAHKKKYQTPEELQAAIDRYFEKMDNEKRAYTVQGLAYELGFTCTEALQQYEAGEGYEVFHDIMKMAKLRIEAYKAEGLQDKSKSTIGLIFDLKANYGWQDKKEITHTFKQGPDIDLSKVPEEVLKQLLNSQDESK